MERAECGRIKDISSGMLLPNEAGEIRESMLFKTFQSAKRYLRIGAGFTLLALGVAMFLTPLPGWLTILFGLGILAAEYGWARRLLGLMEEERERLRMVLLDRPAPAGPEVSVTHQS
ncbi:MAG TPA: PGPGW domain-containing protein [Candidatus Acidoferrales bacterium]|nr:PGPGW domain-containing protein [Candidatus Acidoferrales bacterium]